MNTVFQKNLRQAIARALVKAGDDAALHAAADYLIDGFTSVRTLNERLGVLVYYKMSALEGLGYALTDQVTGALVQSKGLRALKRGAKQGRVILLGKSAIVLSKLIMLMLIADITDEQADEYLARLQIRFQYDAREMYLKALQDRRQSI